MANEVWRFSHKVISSLILTAKSRLIAHRYLNDLSKPKRGCLPGAGRNEARYVRNNSTVMQDFLRNYSALYCTETITSDNIRKC